MEKEIRIKCLIEEFETNLSEIILEPIHADLLDNELINILRTNIKEGLEVILVISKPKVKMTLKEVCEELGKNIEITD